MKAKLQLTLNELSKAKSMQDQERNENTELTEKLHELEEKLEHVTKDSALEMEYKVQELEKLLEEKETVENELKEQRKLTHKLRDEIDELESVKIELEDSRDLFDQEKHNRSTLERRFQDMEQMFDDQKIEHENIQQTLTAKVSLLMKLLASL